MPEVVRRDVWEGVVGRLAPFHRRSEVSVAVVAAPQRQYARLTDTFDAEEHLAVKIAWLIYQKIIASYADPTGAAARKQ